MWSPPWCRIVSPLLQTKRNSISDFTQTQTFSLLHGTIWSPNWNSVRNSWWIRVFKVFAIKVSHQCSYLNPWRILLSFGFLIRIFEEFYKHGFAISGIFSTEIHLLFLLAKVDDYISDISCMFLNPNMYLFPIWILIVLIYQIWESSWNKLKKHSVTKNCSELSLCW